MNLGRIGSNHLNKEYKVMKADAPEKVYLLFNRPYLVDYAKLNKRRCKEEVEYTRTDAFMKKAEEFIYSALNDGIMDTANIEDFMRLFKNYMKGE